MFNSTYNVPQYCDADDNWIAMTGGNPENDRPYIPNATEFVAIEGDYLENLSPTGMPNTTQFTVSFWKYFNTFSANRILRIGTPTDAALSISTNNSQENFWFNMHDAGGSEILRFRSTPGQLRAGRWYHYLASVDLSDPNRRHLYINGEDASAGLQTHTNTVFPASTANSIEIGGTFTHALDANLAEFWFDAGTYLDLSLSENREKFINSARNPVFLGNDGSLPTGGAPDIFLSGDTDHWHINKGTSGAFTEVGTLSSATSSPYTPRTQVVPSGLIGHWRLDETSGTTIYDSSGNGNNGALLGGSGTIAGYGVPSPIGSHIDFANSPPDNSGNRIEVSNVFPIGTNPPFSVTMWLKRDFSYQSLFEGGGVLEIRGNTSIWSPSRWDVWNITSLADKWEHLALTYNGTIFYVYVDGVLKGSSTQSMTTTNGNFKFGSLGGAHGNGGTDFDDVRLYSRPLTVIEINELYQARDGIRYNSNHRRMEYFDGNRFVSMTPEWAEVDRGPIYGGFPDLACPNVGDICSDGSVYVGTTPDGNVPMYMTSAAFETSGAFGAFSETGNQVCDSGGSNEQCWAGEANTAALAAMADVQTVPRYCLNLSAHGNDDWYLPSRAEFYVIHQMHDAVGSDLNTSDYYWSSSESDTISYIWTVNASTGHFWHEGWKGNNLPARCVRKASREVAGTGGLVSHWAFDEGEGATAEDSVSGNNGTLNGGPVWVPKGVHGGALLFDGVDDYVEVANESAFDSGPFSISLWHTTNAMTVSGHALLAKRDASNNGYSITRNGNGNGLAYRLDGTSNPYRLADTTTLNDDGWQHVVLVYDGTSFSGIYNNGVMDNTNTDPSTGALTQNNNALLIGGNTAGTATFWPGMIDEVRFYNRALTEAEIQVLFNQAGPVGQNLDDPEGCPSIGDVCDDGTIYAGLSPDGNVEMYAAPHDSSTEILTWGPSTDTSMVNCVSPHSQASCRTGRANTLFLLGLGASYPAAQYCANLNFSGYSDWYLPARAELNRMFENLSDGNPEGTHGFTHTLYWSSSEVSSTNANKQHLGTGSIYGWGKNDTNTRTRCVRKGPAPRCANPYGIEGQMIYNTSHDVVQFCDGARWIAIGKRGP
ncbi:LamG-like jellyroll fold domain-containing protein [Celeribacter indicus]|nr:LamG-like jellyroll fold domain-containing protein [Celeribacter indicus]